MTDPSTPLSTFEWTPPTAGIPQAESDEPLAERLSSLVEDRAASAADVVRRAARTCHGWLVEPSCADAGVGALLEQGLGELVESQGWRAPVARFRASLAAVADRTPDDGGPALREALASECALWLETAETLAGPGWDDAAERPRLRLPDRGDCARPLLQGRAPIEEGEVFLVHGWSETVARGLELVQARGLAPEVIVSEGGPDLGGRRLARRLGASGMKVRFVYDAALVAAVRRADRVWLGTDALGTDEFLGRVGTGALVECARELGVPTTVLATTDKLTPGGELELPTWADGEAWHLWESAPKDVEVEAQPFESVGLEWVDGVATEVGLMLPGDLQDAPLRAI